MKKIKLEIVNKKSNYFNNLEKNLIIQIRNNSTFNNEILEIKNKITDDINECRAKKAKDIIIIIDFNIYNPEQQSSTDKIESYINQTKKILEEYLSINDRLCVFIYSSQYKIICPLLSKNEIDLDNFYNDLISYKKIKEKEEESENESEEDFDINEINNEKINKKGFEFQKGSNNNFSDSQSQESFGNEKNSIKISDKMKGLIDTINFTKKYLKIKEGIKNERYLIIFTDLFNYYKISDEVILNNINNLEEDKDIVCLLIGKHNLENAIKGKNTLLEEDDEKELKKILLNKFGKQSEIIYYENMKKIKNILSNNVIRDDIIFPNEIYK